MEYRGKTALVTGASSGLGVEFARLLAERGTDVVLVARSEEKLLGLADELQKDRGIRADVIAADLAAVEGPATVAKRVADRPIDLLVNNAGVGTYGAFARNRRLEDLRRQVAVNVGAVVELTHALLPAMLDRGEGAVVNVASTAAFQPDPYMAVYGASKAFVLSFSEALWAEVHPHGIKVLALCPGGLRDTAFWSGTGDPRSYTLLTGTGSARGAVEAGLEALEDGRPYVIPRWRDWLLAQSVRFGSRSNTARTAEKMKRLKTWR